MTVEYNVSRLYQRRDIPGGFQDDDSELPITYSSHTPDETGAFPGGSYLVPEETNRKVWHLHDLETDNGEEAHMRDWGVG